MDNKKKVLALIFVFPSTILAVSLSLWLMIKKNILSENVALIIILLIVFNTLFLGVKYALQLKKKD